MFDSLSLSQFTSVFNNLPKLAFLRFFLILFKVAGQDYESHVSPEYIIKGNDVLMKCGIPSFVADFVQVIGWLEESTNQELFPSDKSMGTFFSH